MGKRHAPRRGSMQYWPRKKAKKLIPRVRSLVPHSSEIKLAEFSGYKAGMTHVTVTDNRKSTKTKGEEISIPVTVIECPKLKVIGARSYKLGDYGLELVSEEIFNVEKNTNRKTNLTKNTKQLILENTTEIRAVVQTQPSFKKTPEIFEMRLSGNNPEEQYKYIKENRELSAKDVLEEGQYVDVHSITKGKGFQGPVKRFGVTLRAKKSEKSVRNPGSLGPWKGHAHILYRVAHAGQLGFFLRTEYSKFIMKISENPEEVNPKGGFLRFGNLSSDYILVKGSVPGPKKRFVRLTPGLRKKKEEAPVIERISKESKQ